VIDQPGVWSDLEVGAFMRDKNGEVWKVTKVDEWDGHVTQITNRSGRVADLKPRPPSTPVTRVVPTMDEAIRTVEQMLGGKTVDTFVNSP
jgi:hypothetical protein